MKRMAALVASKRELEDNAPRLTASRSFHTADSPLLSPVTSQAPLLIYGVASPVVRREGEWP